MQMQMPRMKPTSTTAEITTASSSTSFWLSVSQAGLPSADPPTSIGNQILISQICFPDYNMMSNVWRFEQMLELLYKRHSLNHVHLSVTLFMLRRNVEPKRFSIKFAEKQTKPTCHHQDHRSSGLLYYLADCLVHFLVHTPVQRCVSRSQVLYGNFHVGKCSIDVSPASECFHNLNLFWIRVNDFIVFTETSTQIQVLNSHVRGPALDGVGFSSFFPLHLAPFYT